MLCIEGSNYPWQALILSLTGLWEAPTPAVRMRSGHSGPCTVPHTISKTVRLSYLYNRCTATDSGGLAALCHHNAVAVVHVIGLAMQGAKIPAPLATRGSGYVFSSPPTRARRQTQRIWILPALHRPMTLASTLYACIKHVHAKSLGLGSKAVGVITACV